MAWKEAASVILTFAAPRLRPGNLATSGSEIEILLMKRASKSSFMPDKYVFPGGALDPVDLDPQWLTRFPTLKTVSVPISKERIPLFRKYADNPVSGEIAFRLCALRETFEESGVLLGAKSPNEPVSMNSLKDFGVSERQLWRNRVKDNPLEFINLFEKLQILPDIWSLHEWSNWLTPQYLKKRYDTVFFIAFPREIPFEIDVDESEMSDAKNMRPVDIQQMYFGKVLQVGNPQIYEISRLCNFHTTEDLEKFAIMRAKEGNIRYSVIRIVRDDKVYFLLPGDSNYRCGHEDDLNYEYPTEIPIIEDGDLNRMVVDKDGGTLYCNVTDSGHKKPILLRSKL